MEQEIFFFHVNPPEQRGRQRDKKSRATFCGIYDPQTNDLRIGISYCHTADQFSRKIGRIKSRGNAMSKQGVTYHNVVDDARDVNDYFVNRCREACELVGMNHQYDRRKKTALMPEVEIFQV